MHPIDVPCLLSLEEAVVQGVEVSIRLLTHSSCYAILHPTSANRRNADANSHAADGGYWAVGFQTLEIYVFSVS